MTKIKPLAFYLPQYHPIPENDKWWGKGFTEWTNVTKAKPLFSGHIQPNLPADLGFYDLRVSEAREQQAKIAKEYGVYGFVYYHYWFGNGKQLLETVANEVLSTKSPNFPFCFCWANESWTGVWHGLKDKSLIKQTYPSDEDLQKHYDYLINFFRDDRYIKVENKPLFIIYDPIDLHEHGDKYLEKLNKLARNDGFDGIYLVASNRNEDEIGYKKMLYDGKISHAFNKSWGRHLAKTPNIFKRLIRKATMTVFKNFRKPQIVDGKKIFAEMNFVKADVETYPMVLPNWDNTPRSGINGNVIKNATPETLYLQLDKAKNFLKESELKENFLFIKSWNEWAEGNILEPNRQHGLKFLETLQQFLSKD
ncbi:glycoside hydrolase family 99-like domain-containing protein [Sphingobacterium corticis]|uniref:Glycoside hydrolase family 99-like domain-containing protein n=1 Tax=Sphingobacterium corticis TaxID=1812823 RepID=A0ABW5NGP7_9SPHI